METSTDNSRRVALRQLRVGVFLLRLAFDGLMIVMLLVRVVYLLVLEATGGRLDGGIRPNIQLLPVAGLLATQIVVITTVLLVMQDRGPTASQRLSAISWWLVPLNLVTLYLLAI